MSKKSRMFLGFASLALMTSLALRFLPVDPTHRVGDFMLGLGVAFMVGALVKWRADRAPRS